jgi:hypothetical protein
MSDATRILSAIEKGEPQAAEQLLPLIYDELRRLAAQNLASEKPGHTLQATALVHEAYLRLVNAPKAQQWNSRGHFFVAAAEAMRRILIESARRRARLKRGGDLKQESLAEDAISARAAANKCWRSTNRSISSRRPTKWRPSSSSCAISPDSPSPKQRRLSVYRLEKQIRSGLTPGPGWRRRSAANRRIDDDSPG